MLGDFVASDFCSVFFAFTFEAPDALGLPDAEEKHGGDQRDYARRDVYEIAVHVVGPEELRSREREADYQDRGKNFPGFRPTDHGANEPEGDNYRGDREDAADHGAEIAFVEGGDGGKGVDGSADGAPSDRGGESGAAFDECAEAEGDEEELQATVGGDGGDGLLHDFKLTGFDGDVVEEDGGDDDPDDF